MASLSHPTKKRRKKKRKMSQWWSEISLLFSAVPSSSFSSPIFSSINGQLRVGARGRVLLARWNARLSSNNKVFPGAAVAEFCATVSPNFERKMLCLFIFFLFQKKICCYVTLAHCSYKTVSFDEVVLYTIYLCNKNVVQQIIIICNVDNRAEKGKTVWYWNHSSLI